MVAARAYESKREPWIVLDGETVEECQAANAVDRAAREDFRAAVAATLRWAAERTRDGSLATVTCGCGCGCGCGNQLDRDADDLTREQRAVIADPGT